MVNRFPEILRFFFKKNFLLAIFLALLFLGSLSCSSLSSIDILMDSKIFDSYDPKSKLYLLEDFKDEVLQDPDRPVYSVLKPKLQYISEKETSLFVRATALEVLELTTGSESEKSYLKALEDPSFLVRYTAIVILQKHSTDRAVKPLLKIVKADPSSFCRMEAARALANINKPEILDSLMEIFPEEKDLGVQMALHNTLQKITNTQQEFYPEVWKEWQESPKKP